MYRVLFTSFCFVSILYLGGCASLPTNEEIQQADYGQFNGGFSNKEAEMIVRQSIAPKLTDPYSAKYVLNNMYASYMSINYMHSSIGAIIDGKTIFYGYILEVDVNSKNIFGGYTGYKRYRFLFRNRELVGFCSGVNCGLIIKI